MQPQWKISGIYGVTDGGVVLVDTTINVYCAMLPVPGFAWIWNCVARDSHAFEMFSQILGSPLPLPLPLPAVILVLVLVSFFDLGRPFAAVAPLCLAGFLRLLHNYVCVRVHAYAVGYINCIHI